MKHSKIDHAIETTKDKEFKFDKTVCTEWDAHALHLKKNNHSWLNLYIIYIFIYIYIYIYIYMYVCNNDQWLCKKY